MLIEALSLKMKILIPFGIVQFYVVLAGMHISVHDLLTHCFSLVIKNSVRHFLSPANLKSFLCLELILFVHRKACGLTRRCLFISGPVTRDWYISPGSTTTQHSSPPPRQRTQHAPAVTHYMYTRKNNRISWYVCTYIVVNCKLYIYPEVNKRQLLSSWQRIHRTFYHRDNT